MQKPLYLIFIELLGQEILTSTIYLFRFSIFFLIVFLDITKDNVKGRKILAYDNVFENIVIKVLAHAQIYCFHILAVCSKAVRIL